MLFLVLAIVCSVLISVGMRVSERYSKNTMAMFAANYAVCLMLSRGFMGRIHLFEAQAGIGAAIGMGLVSGVLYLVSFMLLQKNIHESGVVLSSASMKLGAVLIPVIVSLIFFHENMNGWQTAGVITAVAAILMIHLEKDSFRAGEMKAGLLLLLLCSGITDTMANLYDKMGEAALRDHYLFFTFLAALVLALAAALRSRQKLRAADLICGLLIGIPNYFSSRFLLLALGEIPAVVAYPVFSAGTIIMVALIGLAVFHERLSPRKACAMALILAALGLLNAGRFIG